MMRMTSTAVYGVELGQGQDGLVGRRVRRCRDRTSLEICWCEPDTADHQGGVRWPVGGPIVGERDLGAIPADRIPGSRPRQRRRHTSLAKYLIRYRVYVATTVGSARTRGTTFHRTCSRTRSGATGQLT